jgi:hypothetical protein
VALYCTDSVACNGLRDHLRKTGIDFLDKYPKDDPVAGAEFDALGGQGVPLVVFKQRLMHGYYPSSFDRLYAQYQTGVAQAPPPQPAATQSANAPTPGQAAVRVEDIAPAAFAAYIQLHPAAVVQFTSPDHGCIYCVDGSFEVFDAIAAAHATKGLPFVRVQWSPWAVFPKELLAMVNGLPSQIVFKNGLQKNRFEGSIGPPARQQKFRSWLAPELGATP